MYTDWIDYDLRDYDYAQIKRDLADRGHKDYLIREDLFDQYDNEKVVQRVYIIT